MTLILRGRHSLATRDHQAKGHASVVRLVEHPYRRPAVRAATEADFEVVVMRASGPVEHALEPAHDLAFRRVPERQFPVGHDVAGVCLV
jgi:hypothetical protein